MGDEVFFNQLTPVVASTSLRHNTVDVWDKCAYYTNNRVVHFDMTNFIIFHFWQHQTLKELSRSQYTCLGYRLVLLLSRDLNLIRRHMQDCRDLLPIYT